MIIDKFLEYSLDLMDVVAEDMSIRDWSLAALHTNHITLIAILRRSLLHYRIELLLAFLHLLNG